MSSRYGGSIGARRLRTMLWIVASIIMIGCLSGCNSGSGFSQPDSATPIGFTVSGSISGLNAAGLVLQLNGANNLSASGTSFSFQTKLKPNASYALTVLSQPTGETCTVNGGSGPAITGNVSAQIVCSVDTYAISGSVTGLAAGNQITLLNNSSGATTVTSNSNFSFSQQVAYGSAYDVTIRAQPIGQNCSISNGSASSVTADVSNVAISCVAPSLFVLYSFGSYSTDSVYPYDGAPLLGADGNFYGVTASGGLHNEGMIFKMSPLGVETMLYSFSASGATDGFYPYGAPLIFGADGAMYGTTYEEGPHGCGTVYRITTTGQFSVVYAFGAVSQGPCYEYAGLVLGSDGNFYGLSFDGGTNNLGTIYKVTPGGVMTVLHNFSGPDGEHPEFTTMVEDSAGNFYGVTPYGGTGNNGVVFKLSAGGTYSVLHAFTSISNDGFSPYSSLVFGADGDLYGNTYSGGTNGHGVAYKITTGGSYSILHNYAGGANDGSEPYGQPFVLGPDGNFYSSSYLGGLNSLGTLYKMTPAGAVTVLHSFAGGTADAETPYSGIVFGTDGYIYGWAYDGGQYNKGVFYRY